MRTLSQPIKLSLTITESAPGLFTSRSLATIESLAKSIGIDHRTVRRWVADKSLGMPRVTIITRQRNPVVIGFDIREIRRWLIANPHVFAGLKHKPNWPVNLIGE